MSVWIKKLAEAYTEVDENQKASLAKKLARSAASSEKGKAAVTMAKAPWDKKDPPEAVPEGMSSKEKMKKGLYNSKINPVVKADIDEISKKSLGSYVKKASDDRAYNAYEVGKGKDPFKSGLKGLKRRQGINRAVNKMASEETVNELGNVLSEFSYTKKLKKASVALIKYAKTDGGIDKKEFMMAAKLMQSNDFAKLKSYVEDMDTEPREHVMVTMAKHMGNTYVEKMFSVRMRESTTESRGYEVYARILEARKAKATADKGGEHSKSATDPEDWNEKEKNNKGAMDMKADMKAGNPDIIDNPEADDQMAKATNAAPSAATRKGDNAAGDNKIIPSATPMKGK